MKNQVKIIIAQTTFLEKNSAHTLFVSACRNHSTEQKINHKNKSGTECTALQRVLFGRFHVSITT